MQFLVRQNTKIPEQKQHIPIKDPRRHPGSAMFPVRAHGQGQKASLKQALEVLPGFSFVSPSRSTKLGLGQCPSPYNRHMGVVDPNML